MELPPKLEGSVENQIQQLRVYLAKTTNEFNSLKDDVEDGNFTSNSTVSDTSNSEISRQITELSQYIQSREAVITELETAVGKCVRWYYGGEYIPSEAPVGTIVMYLSAVHNSKPVFMVRRASGWSAPIVPDYI